MQNWLGTGSFSVPALDAIYGVRILGTTRSKHPIRSICRILFAPDQKQRPGYLENGEWLQGFQRPHILMTAVRRFSIGGSIQAPMVLQLVRP